MKKLILNLLGIKEKIKSREKLIGRVKRAGSDTWKTVLEIKNPEVLPGPIEAPKEADQAEALADLNPPGQRGPLIEHGKP